MGGRVGFWGVVAILQLGVDFGSVRGVGVGKKAPRNLYSAQEYDFGHNRDVARRSISVAHPVREAPDSWPRCFRAEADC